MTGGPRVPPARCDPGGYHSGPTGWRLSERVRGVDAVASGAITASTFTLRRRRGPWSSNYSTFRSKQRPQDGVMIETLRAGGRGRCGRPPGSHAEGHLMCGCGEIGEPSRTRGRKTSIWLAESGSSGVDRTAGCTAYRRVRRARKRRRSAAGPPGAPPRSRRRRSASGRVVPLSLGRVARLGQDGVDDEPVHADCGAAHPAGELGGDVRPGQRRANRATSHARGPLSDAPATTRPSAPAIAVPPRPHRLTSGT